MRLAVAALPDPVNLRIGRSQIGIPPSLKTPTIRTNDAGEITIAGQSIPIAPLPATLSVPSNAMNVGKAPLPAPVSDEDNIGESVTLPIVFAGAGEVIALRRPQGRRIGLLIQNLSVVGNVFYCFDRAADNATCVAIGAGGNRLFDKAIPQGDLHIFSTGAGTVIVEVINK